MTIIEKLVLNKKITNEEIEEELVKICSRIHHLPSVCHECPIYKINGNKLVNLILDMVFVNVLTLDIK